MLPESHLQVEPHSEPRVRRRDILRSLASRSTTRVMSELSKLYYPPDHDQESNITPRSQELHRTDTDDINNVINSPQDTITPHCMLYPTYATQIETEEGTRWKMDIGGWVYAMPSPGRMERLLLAVGRTYGGLMVNSAEDNHFVSLLNQFRCQTIRNIDVNIRLGKAIESMGKLVHEHEQRKAEEGEAEEAGTSMMLSSGPSGRFQDTWMLNPVDCENSIEKKLLQLEAIFDGVNIPNRGLVDLIDSEGISVISDIDDTIKITGVLDGRDAILRNTFFKKAQEVPGMSKVYQTWADQGIHIHYVSNSPWQVYPALREFFEQVKFPQGSMHLRVINTQDIIRGKPMQHKLDVIPRIIQDFPKRKFILIGDSGEHDPEIYQEIYRQFPDQIIKVFIRDVSSELAIHADNNKDTSSSERMYNIIRKFISQEHSTLKRTNTSQTAMDAITNTEVPKSQQVAMDPSVPQATRLELFKERMEQAASDMKEGAFTVFKSSTQLITDPVVTEEFLVASSTSLSI
ncbi:hypothetical protein PHYBLDRAFT_178624, partial [Phycomyces blakesleeanus NRRL 1555(-)]